MSETKYLSPKIITIDGYINETDREFDKRIEAVILFYLKDGWNLINVTYLETARAKIILIK